MDPHRRRHLPDAVNATGTRPHAAPGARVLAGESLVVPTVSLYEILNRVMQQRGKGYALQAVALRHQGMVVDLTPPIALAADKGVAGLLLVTA